MSAIWIIPVILFIVGIALIFLRSKSKKNVPIEIDPPPVEVIAESEPEKPPPEPFDAEKEFDLFIANAPDIQDLFGRLDDFSKNRSTETEAIQRKDYLCNLIIDVLAAKHQSKLLITDQIAPDEINLTTTKHNLQQKAKRYLDTRWLHTPPLATLFVVVLIDCELAKNSDLTALRLIRDELSSGSFDTGEIIRRLRQAERQGCYFSSLVYALLTDEFTVEPLPEPEPEPEPVAEVVEPPVEEEPIPEELEPIWHPTIEVANLINNTPELETLREQLEHRLWGNPSSVDKETTQLELEQFYRLLETAITIQHEYQCNGKTPVVDDLKRHLQYEAKKYNETPSLFTPKLSNFILTSLLYAEMATLDELQENFAPILRVLMDDVALNNCTVDETSRRLRQLEDRGLFVSSLVYAFLKPEGFPDTTPSDTLPSVDSDLKQTVPELIETNSELSSLYKKLGYSAELDRNSSQLLKEMKDLIRTEIPDFGAFKSALRAAQEQADRQTTVEIGMTAVARVKYQTENQALLTAVLAAADDQTRVLEVLNRDPINEQLPFIEQLPVSKNGVVIWRTPLEHSLIRKRPSDPERFAALLDQLESLFNEAKQPQNRQVHEEVLEAISRVRRDLAKEMAYMPTALQALESKVADYMAHSRNAATQVKKEQLDALLEELLNLRREFSTLSREPDPVVNPGFLKYRQRLQQQAKRYLETAWMHTPWLTTCILATLLDSELAVFDKETISVTETPAGVLKIVRDELSLGTYDSDESIRRLQYQETRGLYVNSLVYPLLRLNSLNGAGR